MSDVKKKITGVFLVLAGSAFLEVLSNVVVGRSLTADQFGQFKFITVATGVLSTLLILGQNSAIIRTLSKIGISTYNWKIHVARCIVVSTAIGAVAVYIITIVYPIKWMALYVFLTFVLGISVELIAAIMRADNEYSTSMFLTKTSSILFGMFSLLLFYNSAVDKLSNVLMLYILSFAISLCLGIFRIKDKPNGGAAFPIEAIKEGMWLFLITASFSLMTQIDQFFVAKMLSFKELAGYSIIITVSRTYDLATTALWFVLVSIYARDEKRAVINDATKALCIGLAFSVVYYLFGEALINCLFNGRYDGYKNLLPFFMAVGTCKVLYAIPGGIIGGRLSEKYLKLFLFLSLFGIALNTTGNLFLIPKYGLYGTAISTTLSWVFRIVSSYWVVYLEIKNIKSASNGNLVWAK